MGLFRLALVILLSLVPMVTAGATAADPSPASVDPDRLGRIDAAILSALERKELPGAVVLIVHRDKVVFRKAFGQRAVKPKSEDMTADTVFDLASLTKPVATATSIMLLAEQGKLSLADRVAKHWPAFGAKGKDKITVEQLLLHTSGLVADNDLADYRDGKDKALEHIAALTPTGEPGSRFAYSDVGYIVLGELVERVAGVPMDEFAMKNIFDLLGMKETTFRPEGKLRERAAPTQRRDDHWMQGEVHDPRAYALGGVAGHAGLFSTADDLAIYVRMLLHGGAYNDKRILSPLTVRLMTTPHEVPGGLRALGWDVQTSFSSNRGELFPRGEGYGHTGFTGTSLWIDPVSETAVIFLSNRVHPDGKGNVTRLRGQVATLAAAALLDVPSGPGRPITAPLHPLTSSPPHVVLTGIDVLDKEKFAHLKGCKVGLVTNHTGLDRDGRTTIDLLHKADGVTLVALFSPEHGIRGALDEKIADTKDERTGLPIYSLYGERRNPTADTLKGIDTFVFDIQDAGCRFYTYISTLLGVLEAASENKVKVVVLDRPNPLGGLAVEGPILDAGRESFVGCHALPIRHGMTVGELALLFKAERKLTCDLEVIKMDGWRRGDTYDRTDLTWVNPSPNLRSLGAALLYPGSGLLETTNISVGRGTERPFEWVGAPWIDGRKLALEMMKQDLPGVRFVPLKLTPSASTHKGKQCDGIQLLVDDWWRFQPVRTGLALACTLHKLYPDDWKLDRFDTLLIHKGTLEGLKRGAAWQELEKDWQANLEQFLKRRRPYLLYGN